MSGLLDQREVRKIQFTGKSTYILSLPKKWIEEMHLNAGDQVTLVRESDNSLAILPEAGKKPDVIDQATAILSPKESANTLRRKVVAMYLAGHSIIHLKVKSGRILSSQRDAVRELVRRNLVGTELIADASDIITLQVLLSIPELSVSTAIRRMYLIASSMHKDAMTSISEHNNELAGEVMTSDDEVDRFSLYVLRNLVIATQNGRFLREIGLQNPSDCLSYRVAVKSIERIADHASAMAEWSMKLEGKIPHDLSEKIWKMSTLALNSVADSVESLLRRDYEMADKTIEGAEGIYPLEGEAIASLEKAKIPHDSATIKLILEDIRRTAEYASDIAEAAINETIDDVIERQTASRRSQ
jgi:phosphate uptake regulator